MQVHRDVGQERHQRDGVVRGAAEAGDDAAVVAAAARGVGAEEGRQEVRRHVEMSDLFSLTFESIDDVWTAL